MGSLWVVVGRCGVVVDRSGSLWVVVGRCGSFHVLVTTNIKNTFDINSICDCGRGEFLQLGHITWRTTCYQNDNILAKQMFKSLQIEKPVSIFIKDSSLATKCCVLFVCTPNLRTKFDETNGT